LISRKIKPFKTHRNFWKYLYNYRLWFYRQPKSIISQLENGLSFYKEPKPILLSKGKFLEKLFLAKTLCCYRIFVSLVHLRKLIYSFLHCNWIGHCWSPLHAKPFHIVIVGHLETSYSRLLSSQIILFSSPLHFHSWLPRTISCSLEVHFPLSHFCFVLFNICSQLGDI